MRTLQLALLACTAGMLVCQIGTAPALIGGAVLVGLAYGPVTPAGSLLLTFTIPVRRFGLAFSINRTGVPGGIALAGLILPRTSQAYGWHPSLAGIAAVALAAALALQAGRHLDRPIRRPPPPVGGWGGHLSPIWFMSSPTARSGRCRWPRSCSLAPRTALRPFWWSS
ncbi:MFS transporter [Tistrella bauzanensis]